MRKPLTPVMEENRISTYTLYKWLERLPECCTVATFYYPETLNVYERILIADRRAPMIES